MDGSTCRHPSTDASAWSGPALMARPDWIESLDADDAAEIEVAAARWPSAAPI